MTTIISKAQERDLSQMGLFQPLNAGSNADLIRDLNKTSEEERKEDYGYDEEGRRESRLGKHVPSRSGRAFP